MKLKTPFIPHIADLVPYHTDVATPKQIGGYGSCPSLREKRLIIIQVFHSPCRTGQLTTNSMFKLDLVYSSVC